MLVIRAAITLAVLAHLPSGAAAQVRDPLAAYRGSNLPRWALEVLGAQFQAQYQWYDRVNPFYQRGDFDGDGQVDVAVLVRHKVTGKVGIAFVHRGTRAVHVVGAAQGGPRVSRRGSLRGETGVRRRAHLLGRNPLSVDPTW